MIGRLFKRLATHPSDTAQGHELPPSVERTIQGMSAFVRAEPDDKGRPRILLQFAGAEACGWYHAPSDTRRRLAEAWPDLNARQLDRACRVVEGVIRASYSSNHSGAVRGAWGAWKSARSPIF